MAEPISGSVETLLASYERWRTQLAESNGEASIVLALSYVKDRSSEFEPASGMLALDLVSGDVTAEVVGLSSEESFDAWFVGPAGSARETIHLGRLERDGDVARLDAQLSREIPSTFHIDSVAIVPAGRRPAEDTRLAGAPGFFQRLYYAEQRDAAAFLDQNPIAATIPRLLVSPGDLLVPETERSLRQLVAAPFRTLVPDVAWAEDRIPVRPRDFPNGREPSPRKTREQRLQELIREGETLFTEEEFEGNGRTCASCHPPENNFTIDVPFIQKLHDEDPEDPLFVAEFQDALNFEKNGGRRFENPKLMRELGLIVVNAEGFSDLQRFTMRGVQHTLGLGLTIRAPHDLSEFQKARERANAPSNLITPPNERLGWSGDGAPHGRVGPHLALGTLRDFAIGAVMQHFPKTLGREINRDFRLPTRHELDALEAFQLSLGRQREYELLDGVPGVLVFRDPDVDEGRHIFTNGVPPVPFPCMACHFQGGATQGLGQSFNVNTGVERFLQNRLERSGEPRPPDGGFGTAPDGSFLQPPGRIGQFGGMFTENPDGSMGDQTFNVQSLIEAADTPPFFHNNVAPDLESAIRHYATPEFEAEFNQRASIPLDDAQVDNLAKFLRALNAIENIRSATACLERATVSHDDEEERSRRLAICASDITDAIEVLFRAGVHLGPEDAVFHLILARGDVEGGLLGDAIAALELARSQIVADT